MEYLVPDYVDNPNGWGPPSSVDDSLIPSFMRDLPFSVFNKGERLSKSCDLSSSKPSSCMSFILLKAIILC